ncbi:MAG: hypothetical protein EU547_03370 [Promethearchaeota archaeon]|nr:MAG: hypothetical protein EU547_03370 [Candidatus Lokiarchaeota archaeon]
MSSEDKEDLSVKIGKLGLYLIEQAKEKIKNLNQQILFRKAEIKKHFREQEIKKSKNLRKKFIDQYEQKLNTNLSSTLLSSKEKLLDLKNELIRDFKTALRKEVNQRIEKKYSNYIQYLLENLNQITDKINTSHQFNIYFNERDLNYFNQNRGKINNNFHHNVNLKKSSEIEVGGFKLEQIQEDIIYNYTVDNIINRNYNLLEHKISEQIKDSEIKIIDSEFEKFINKKKEKMEDILIKYDRI